MAKKKKQAAGAAPIPRDGLVPVTVVIDPVDESAAYYANYAEVSLAQYDCILSFVRVPTKLSLARSEEAKSGTLKFEPLVQVILPPTLIPGLIRALMTTKEAFEKISGPIKELGATND